MCNLKPLSVKALSNKYIMSHKGSLGFVPLGPALESCLSPQIPLSPHHPRHFHSVSHSSTVFLMASRMDDGGPPFNSVLTEVKGPPLLA